MLFNCILPINRFKVVVKESKEPHFKRAIRSFDEDVQITEEIDHFIIRTKIDEAEIKNFTSVKSIRRLNDE